MRLVSEGAMFGGSGRMTAQAPPAGHAGHGQGHGQGGKNNRARGRKAAKRATFPYINSQIIKVADAGDADTLVSTIEGYMPQMNLVNLSTALHRLAKFAASSYSFQVALQLQHRPVMAGLLSMAKAALAKSEAGCAPPQCQAFSNITWSLATVQCVDLELLQIAARLSHKHVASFKPFELSASLWAFAKLHSLSQEACDCAVPLFQASAEHIPANVEQFSFRCLVMIAWAFATARQHDERLFQGIASQMLSMVPAAQCQELANAAWAFSTAGVRDDRLFAEIARKAMRQLSDFKPQELSNIMWAFAVAGFFREDFFVAAARVAQTMELQAQQLANILWALSRCRPHHRATAAALLALLPACTGLIQTFKPQELANVALAAAKCFGKGAGESQHSGAGGQIATSSHSSSASLPPQVSDFFTVALPLAATRLQYFSGQSLANLTTSYLAVSIGSGTNLYGNVAREIFRRVQALEPGALLLLMRNLPSAPRDECGAAVCCLFSEATRRFHTFSSKELQVLARICTLLLGMPRQRVLETPELLRICHVLSKEEAWINADTRQLQGGGGVDFDSPQAGEMVQSGTSLETFRPGEEVGVDTGSQQGSPSGSETGGETLLGARRLNYSVKNTFVEYNDEVEGEEVDGFSKPLPPPLRIIPSSVPPEKLEDYRMNYQKFRAGGAVGAKGELSTVTALDLAESGRPLGQVDEDTDMLSNMVTPTKASTLQLAGHIASQSASSSTRAPAPAKSAMQSAFLAAVGHLPGCIAQAGDTNSVNSVSSSAPAMGKTNSSSGLSKSKTFSEDQLPPPLDFMPRFIDLDKLTAFRMDYQKFRTGKATGAKGEISATAKDDKPSAVLESSWALVLPPPLDIIPESVSKVKLAEYRVSYQKFRAGEVRGAKGEVGSAVVFEEEALAELQLDGMRASATTLVGRPSGESGRVDGLQQYAEVASAVSYSDAGSLVQEDDKAGVRHQAPSFSVKNTFVHIDDPGQDEEQDAGSVVSKLPPSLDIIPESVSLERLKAYREDYQKFRAGCASGAKGEVSTLAALDLSDTLKEDVC